MSTFTPSVYTILLDSMIAVWLSLEWVAGIEPVPSGWKPDMLSVKHHTHISKTLIITELLSIVLLRRKIAEMCL